MPVKQIHSVLALVALLGYIGFGILGFFHLSQMAEHHHHLSHETCPFTQMSHSLCTPTLLGHTRVWQDFSSFAFWKTFSFSIVSFVFLAVAALSVFAASIIQSFLYAKNQAPPRMHHHYQSLFAQGILHTKAH